MDFNEIPILDPQEAKVKRRFKMPYPLATGERGADMGRSSWAENKDKPFKPPRKREKGETREAYHEALIEYAMELDRANPIVC